MIIGVIAAMTIPSLKKNTEQKENIARLKKAYSTIANVTDELQQEYGPIKYWQRNDFTVIMDEMYIPKLNVIKNCKNNGGCFSETYQSKTLYGANANDYQHQTAWYTFITADGAAWVYIPRSTCKGSDTDIQVNSCADFQVDVNGIQPPNTIGLDTFGFSLNEDGIYPYGGCPECGTTDCNPRQRGWSCSAKFLIGGQIDS